MSDAESEGSVNVGYYSSSGSDGDFVGCESKSASEAEDEAEAPVDDDSSGTEQSDDDTIRCGLCEGELVELADTEEIGECDSCQRQLTRDEVTLSCPRRNCEWDVCLPCAGRSRASRQTATLPPPPPDALSASPRAVDATAVPAAPAARATPTIPAAPAVPAASAYRAAFVAPLTIRERLQRMGFRARDPVPANGRSFHLVQSAAQGALVANAGAEHCKLVVPAASHTCSAASHVGQLT
jgi:hypothetical protein